MHIHYLQHVECEDPLEILTWAEMRGHTITGTRLDLHEQLPAADGFDALVVMGGPMNIYEYDRFPWLPPEKELIRVVAGAGKGVLGICLGAQLLADVLGGPVTRNPEPEIGWWEVSLTEAGVASAVFAGIPPVFRPMHWHGDTFAIPPGCVHAIRGHACGNQAFVSGDGRCVGLQFHLEENARGVDLLLENWAADIIDAPYVQPAETIRAESDGAVAETRPILFQVLDNWAGELAN